MSEPIARIVHRPQYDQIEVFVSGELDEEATYYINIQRDDEEVVVEVTNRTMKESMTFRLGCETFEI